MSTESYTSRVFTEQRPKVDSAKPIKLRAPAKVYRLIKRKVKGKIVSRFWQVRVRLARGKYMQKSAQTEIEESAREFAVLWIKQEFPKLCRLLDIKPLEKPTLTPPPTVTTGGVLIQEPAAD